MTDGERLARLSIEIRVLNQQTVSNIYGIGQRLLEVKELVGHGGFGAYISQEFGYSQDTANRFMRIAKEYGQDTLPTGLPVSKVYELLALPAAEREEYIAAEHVVDGETRTVESMTVKQLRSDLAASRAQASNLEKALSDHATDYLTLMQAKTAETDKLRAAEAALAARPMPETVTVEVTREVAPADYGAIKADNEDLAQRVRELEAEQMMDTRVPATLQGMLGDLDDTLRKAGRLIRAVSEREGWDAHKEHVRRWCEVETRLAMMMDALHIELDNAGMLAIKDELSKGVFGND